MNVESLVDRYLEAWNEADDDRRAHLLAALFSADAEYRDPVMRGDAPGGINAMIAAARAQFPGAVFHRLGAAEAHHDALRFTWALRAADGADLALGTDVGRLNDDGRLRSVIGFLDPVPAAAT